MPPSPCGRRGGGAGAGAGARRDGDAVVGDDEVRGARERLRAALDRLQVLRRRDALLLDQVLCTTSVGRASAPQREDESEKRREVRTEEVVEVRGEVGDVAGRGV